MTLLLLAMILGSGCGDTAERSDAQADDEALVDPWGVEVPDRLGRVVRDGVAWPMPEAEGFYLVGDTAYVSLDAQPIQAVGERWVGLQSAGTDRARGPEVRLVARSPPSEAELQQAELALRQLAFVKEDEGDGPLGAVRFEVGLWAATAEADLSRTALGSDLHLLTASLAPGVYALHAGEALLDHAAWEQTPSNVRVAYPFEIR